MHRTCPYSGEKFLPKRRNQIFATNLNRIRYYNEKAAHFRDIKAPINKGLDKNHLILTSLVPKGSRKTFKTEELVSKGFNPNIFTHIDEFEGDVCRGIYNFLIPKTKDINTLTVINR